MEIITDCTLCHFKKICKIKETAMMLRDRIAAESEDAKEALELRCHYYKGDASTSMHYRD